MTAIIRRRCPTRDEILDLLAARAPQLDWPAVLEVLDHLGVDLSAALRVEVTEEV